MFKNLKNELSPRLLDSNEHFRNFPKGNSPAVAASLSVLFEEESSFFFSSLSSHLILFALPILGSSVSVRFVVIVDTGGFCQEELLKNLK